MRHISTSLSSVDDITYTDHHVIAIMENLYFQSSDIFIFYAIAIINLAIDMTDNLLCVFALLVDCNVLSGV